VRAVLDPNIIISALLSPSGTPARVFRAWLDGRFDLVASPMLLAELDQALAYTKLRRRIPESEAGQFVEWIRRSATIADDPDDPAPVSSRDPGDDYLLALMTAERAVLVTGDGHLHELGVDLPILTAGAFLALLGD
jgi:putative PIN family toxin of toxin-antitoxin system